MIGILEKKKEEKKEEKTQLSFENQGSMLVFIYFFFSQTTKWNSKRIIHRRGERAKVGGPKGVRKQETAIESNNWKIVLSTIKQIGQTLNAKHEIPNFQNK